jgi:isocitrate lyase
MRKRATVLIVCAALMPHSASAQEAEGRGDALVSAIAACRAVAVDQRLACYEQTTATLIAARDAREIRIVDREAVKRAKRSLFGFSLPNLNLFGTGKEDPRAESDTDVKQITGTITVVQRTSAGMWVFSLAEGGVWQSISDSLTFEPRKGDKITIKAGLLGRYTAKVGDDRAVDVKRVR